MGQEDIVISTVEPTISISGEGVDPIFEDPLPGQSVDPETEVAIATASLKVATLIALADGPKVPSTIYPWS